MMVMLLLFTVTFGSAGCGGGHSSRFVNNDPDEPIPDRIFTVTFNSNGGSPVASQNVLLMNPPKKIFFLEVGIAILH